MSKLDFKQLSEGDNFILIVRGFCGVPVCVRALSVTKPMKTLLRAVDSTGGEFKINKDSEIHTVDSPIALAAREEIRMRNRIGKADMTLKKFSGYDEELLLAIEAYRVRMENEA